MDGKVLPILGALALLALPFAALAVWLAGSKHFESLAAYVVSVGLLLWIVAFVGRTWHRSLLIMAPVWLLSVIFAAYTLLYGDVPGELMAYVLATSSWQEVVGFFGIWQGERLLIGTFLLAAIYVGVAALSPSVRIAGGSRHLRWSSLGACLLLIAFAARNPIALIGGLAANPMIGMAMFVTGPLHSAIASVQGTSMHKVSYGTERVAEEEVHVLIIGESARRDSWSAYGYARKTTPNLDRLRSEIIFFQNAVADANVTICAVPILLTGTSPDRFDMRGIHGNIVDLAREAGYSTAWLMNQDPHISLLTGVHADLMVYPPSLRTLAASRLPLDQILLPEFRREIARAGKARFIGLHVIGSHWAYDSRYPPAFELFGSGEGLTPRDAVSGSLNPKVVDAYDNSVAYTDWFLGQIIDQARALAVPATVTYISDHGEDLYALDGQSGHGAPEYSKHQFDIPAFVWVNAAFRRAHPDKVEAMRLNATKEIRTHNVFYSLADLMGIRWPGARPEASFASSQFAPDTATPVIAGSGGALVRPPAAN